MAQAPSTDIAGYPMATDRDLQHRAEIEALFAELGLRGIVEDDLLRFRAARDSVVNALARFPTDLFWPDEPAHSFRVAPRCIDTGVSSKLFNQSIETGAHG